jgi:uncharacterized protein YcfJ
MNKPIAIAIAGVLVAGAAIGAYRTGLIGTPYADVVSATPITVKDNIYGDVVDVRPVTRIDNVSHQVCADKQVQVRQPERFGNTDGTIIGAVVGGLVGNQIGKGDGRKLATVAGAVGGGYAGHEIDRRHEGGRLVTETRHVCHAETGPKTTTIGYDVQYRSDGQLLSKRVEEDPGERIWLGQQDKIIGYDVNWSYKDQRGHVRMDHDPGKRLPMQDGTVVTSQGAGSGTKG